MAPSSTSDATFGFSNRPMVEYTPPADLSRLIVPTYGFDEMFNREIADILELSWQDPEENYLLNFVINQLYVQMGMVYRLNPVEYMREIQGDIGEQGRFPGLPQMEGFQILGDRLTQEKWYKLIMKFREGAMQFHHLCTRFLGAFPGKDFIYNKYITGGWVFMIAYRNYDL